MDGPRRLRTTTERRLAEPELDLGRRLFPRGLAALVPDERMRFLAICALVGAAAGLAAIAFRLALKGGVFLFFGPEPNLLEAARSLPAWKRLALPAIGAAAAAALAAVIAARGGGGVAGIMEAVSLQKGVVSLRASAAKALCSLFTIASGGSIGREGPIIQLASAVASRIGRLLSIPEERLRVLVACGAAAGFAAAYNTPMAATLFVVEVVAGTTSVELLGPVAVAAVISTAVTNVTLGAGPLYGVQPFSLVSPLELFPYLVLALLSAVLATVMLGSLDVAEWFFARTLRSRVLRAIAGGLTVGGIGLALPHVYGNGFEATVRVLDGRYGAGFLALLLLAKLVATVATVGSGGSGGVFTPTLLVGAALGGLVGDAAHALAPMSTAPPEAYALVGMSALLAATTHAPLLATVFAFEVTRDYAIVLPLLLTGYVAAGLAKALRPHSIYEEEAHRRGIDLGRNLEQRALRALRAHALLREVPALPPGLPLEAVVETFETSRATALHVVDEAGRLLGVIDLHEAREALVAGAGGPPRTAGALARRVPTVPPDAGGDRIEDALYRAGRAEAPVVDADGRFLGVVTRHELEAMVDREVIRRGLRIHESFEVKPVPWPEADTGPAGPAPEAPQRRLEQVPVPTSLVGRRIGESGIRERFRLNVLAVASRRADGAEERRVAGPLTLLSPGEELVVIGEPADLERLRDLG